jgi:beta-carotene 3-hydroxylase
MAILDFLFALSYGLVVTVVFLSMEGVAWFLHKYVMHGFGWFLHEDHHCFTGKRFQKNDVFSVFFAVISFVFILTGILSRFDIRLAIGIGIMFYGIGYFLVHDVFFHRRIRISYRPKSKYMKRVLAAHAVHHQKSTAHTGVNFGFLYASGKNTPP